MRERTFRTFVPARVQSVKQTGKIFARPEKFSLEKRLATALACILDRGNTTWSSASTRVPPTWSAKRKWHESQQLRDVKGGGVELRLKLSSLVEIERWC